MLRRETAQKAIICVLLAVVMIALVAASAVAGAPLQQVARAQGTVAFNAVTDPSQIAEENIGECTFADAKAWVLDNWDAVRQIINDDRYVVLYYHNNDSLRRIVVSDPDTYEGKDVFIAGFTNDEEAATTISDCQDRWDYDDALYFCDSTSVKVEVSIVKWEVDDIPNVNRRISTADMDGFIPTTADIAQQWVPDEDGQVILIHGLDNDYISTIVYINKSVAIVDKTSDDIVCCDLRENIEDLGIKYYYTGISGEDHHHAFTYTANGATITATCSADGCSLVGGKATLTINAPEALGYNGKVKEATLSTYDTDVFSPEVIKYYVDGAEVSAENVKDAGTYVAKVTSNGATAEVSFTIIKINVVKWELSKVPNEHRVLSRDDMEGFAPTSFEIARQWVPEEDDVGQHVYLIYWCKTSKYDEYNYSFIEFINGEYWLHDDVIDDIPLSEFYRDITNGAFYYYTGVKASSGQDEGSQPAKVATPAIIQEGESQADGTVSVTLYCETEGATIYYSLDGSIPNEHSTVYVPGSTVRVPANATIRAVARKAGMQESVLAVESFNSYDPGGNGGGTIGKGDVAPIVVKEPQKAGHGFCVGWVVFIFVMLELLYLALYFILWFPKAAFIVEKCKLTALNDFKNGHILFGVVDMLSFIGLCVSCGVFLFALIALCCHACAVTVVSFIFALLIFAAFVAIFVLDHKDLVKSRIDKIFKKEKREEEPASEAEEAPAEEPASTQNDQE